jgi:hypothetical protein
MKTIALSTAALSMVIFGAMASTAFAAEPVAPVVAQKAPVVLAAAQLDKVTAGGGLVTIKTDDIASDNKVGLNCTVSVGVCGKNDNDF